METYFVPRIQAEIQYTVKNEIFLINNLATIKIEDLHSTSSLLICSHDYKMDQSPKSLDKSTSLSN